MAATNILSMILIATLALATRTDMLQHRIPNVLCATALILGSVLQVYFYGFSGATAAASGCGVGLAMFLPFYWAKGMGAGDVKLMAVVGVFLGPAQTLLAGALTLALGAVLAVGIVLHSRFLAPVSRVEQVLTHEAAHNSLSRIGKQRFPYAAAIALGTLSLLWYDGQIAQLAALVSA